MITTNLNSDVELIRFIENAENNGHKLDCVIAAYSQQLAPQVEDSLNRKVPFFAIDIKNPHYISGQFRRLGISNDSAKALLECPVDLRRGLVPYGFNRNIVTIEAMLRGIDVLFFVDSDVAPSVLKMTPDGPVSEEVDFFGAHLEHIKTGSQVTTGEYSGYNVLPPASFDGMEDLLSGLQKADMLKYWQDSDAHRSLVFQPPAPDPKPCAKILGGNTAITLSAFRKLPPFFSSHYYVDDEMFLCRGEDTVLGLEIAKNGVVCTDIGLHPLHDTYKNFPSEPNLRNDHAVQERFYYACTGWVGRNPFINYFRGDDLKVAREFQRERLERGIHALVGYTSNPRFSSVLKNFDVSWGDLGRYINEYERVLEAWGEYMDKSDLYTGSPTLAASLPTA